MRLRKLVLMISVASLALSGKVSALGLGEITLKSSLNEPLNAEIRLLQVRDLTEEEILVGLASNADFERIGVDKSFFLTGMKFKVDLESTDGPVVKITTNSPVREPFLNFLVESQWPSGRILREYTLLMDLPVFSAQSQSGVQAPSQGGSSAATNTPTTQSSAVRTRPVNRSQAATYNGDTYGPVSSNDTLWNIAIKVRPSRDFSVQQTMIAIQRLNPDAFINDNINLLRKGQVLRVPTTEQVAELTFNQAVNEVAFQNDQWDKGASTKPTLVSETGSSSATTPQSTGGRVTLGVGDVDSGSAETSSGRGAGTETSSALQNDLSIALEELDTAKRENTDLKSRIADLEKQIDTMERLVEVSSSELRALQLASEQSNSEDATSESSTEAPVFESDLENNVDNEAETSGEANSTDVDAMAEGNSDGEMAESDTADATPAASEQPKPEVKPAVPDARTVVSTSSSAKKPSFMDSIMDNIVLIAAVLIAVLIAAFLLVKKLFGGKEEELEDTFNPFEDDQAEQAVVDDDLTSDLDANLDDISEEIADTSDSDEFAEPVVEEDLSKVVPEEVIAEADIYIAYGKYDQAEEMLERALRADPTNTDARIKLLEVYAESGELNKFDKAFYAVHETGDAAAIKRGNELRGNFSGAEPYVFTGVAAAAGAAAAAAYDSHSAEPVDDDITHPDLSAEFAGLEEGAENSTAADTDEFDSFDFDLDPEFGNEDSTSEIALDSDSVSSDDETQLNLAAEFADLQETSPDYTEADVTIQRRAEDLDLDLAAFEEDLSLEDPDASGELVTENDFDISLDLDDDLATPSTSEFALDLNDNIVTESDTEIVMEDDDLGLEPSGDLGSFDDLEELEIGASETDEVGEIDDLTITGDELSDTMFTKFDSDLDLGDANLGDDDESLDLDPSTLAFDEEETESSSLDLTDSLDLDVGMDRSFDAGDLDNSGLDAIDGELELAGKHYDNLESTSHSMSDTDMDLELDDLEHEQDEVNQILDTSDSAMDDFADDTIDGDEIANFGSMNLDDHDLAALDEEAEDAEIVAEVDLDALDEEMDALATDVGLDQISSSNLADNLPSDMDDAFNSDDVFAEVLASTEQDLDDLEPEDDLLGDDMDDNMDFLADTDESDTKLDLARAYIDMGDGDGARDILNEVLSDGNDQQREEAQSLMDKIPG